MECYLPQTGIALKLTGFTVQSLARLSCHHWSSWQVFCDKLKYRMLCLYSTACIQCTRALKGSTVHTVHIQHSKVQYTEIYNLIDYRVYIDPYHLSIAITVSQASYPQHSLPYLLSYEFTSVRNCSSVNSASFQQWNSRIASLLLPMPARRVILRWIKSFNRQNKRFVRERIEVRIRVELVKLAHVAIQNNPNGQVILIPWECQ